MNGTSFSIDEVNGRRPKTFNALWVPDAQLLFQWAPLSRVKYVRECTAFPPSGTEATVLERTVTVSDEAIAAARTYLKKRKQLESQERVLKHALRRVRGSRQASENDAQKAFKSVSAFAES